MIKKFKISCIGLMVIISGFSGLFLMIQTVNGTEVSGNIAATTTWDTAGSPYYITADLTIDPGVSLEIVPDSGPVNVIFNGSFKIFVQGNLYVNGTGTNSVYFMSNQVVQTHNQWGVVATVGPVGKVDINHAVFSGAASALDLETENNVVKNTEMYNCTNGIYVNTADFNYMDNVWSHDNYNYGVFITAGENNTIENCNVSSNRVDGVHAEANSNYMAILNTSVNNNGPVGSETGIYILNSHFSSIDNCTANNNAGNGIALSTSNWNTVSNCTGSTNGDYGVSIYNAFNNTIKNNVYSGNTISNIKLKGSGYNNIDNNTANTCQWSIDLIMGSNHNIISNNTFVDHNGVSIDLGCDNNTIKDNYIEPELTLGLRITGISQDNIVKNNTITKAPGQGISLEGSASRNIVTENTIIDNPNIGIHVTGSAFGNYIYHNNFFNNTQHAYDDTGLNYWNTTYSASPLMGGNYWDNYTGIDQNSTAAQNIPPADGIGDTPYTWIDGGTGTQDNYPLIEPYGGIPPESSVDPIAQYWHNSAAVLTASASDVGSGVSNVSLWYRYSTDNVIWGNWTLSGTDTAEPWNFNFNFGPGNGYYEFYTIAEDNSSNMEAAPLVADQSCAYDQTNPTSSLAAISDYIQKSGSLQINATATDGLSGMASVSLWYRYSSNGSTWGGWTEHSTDYAVPWSFNFNFPEDVGYYEFYSIGTDNATNSESAPTSADTSCLYDAAVPTSSVDALSSYWFNAEPVEINATASDDIGLASVELMYRYSDDNATWGTWTSFGTEATEPWSWNFDFPDGDGWYEFFSVAEDTSGNTEPDAASADVNCALDMTAPISSIEAESPYWRNSLTGAMYSVNWTDAVSGIHGGYVYYRYSIDNATWGNWTEYAFASESGEGYYQYYIVADDNAGNVEAAPTAADMSLAYDITAPTIVDSTPATGTAGENFTFTVAVTDNMALKGVQIFYVLDDNQTNVTMALDSGSYQRTITIPNGAQTVTYRIMAYDQAGNWQTLAEESVTISQPVPNDNPQEFPWIIVVLILVISMAAVLGFLFMHKKPEHMVEKMDKEDGYENSDDVEEEAEEEDYSTDSENEDMEPEEITETNPDEDILE